MWSIKELHSDSRRDSDGLQRALSPRAERAIVLCEYPWLLESGTLFYKPASLGHVLAPPLAMWAPRLGFCLDFSGLFWKHFFMQHHDHLCPILWKPGPVSLR